jgi:carboxyl-terminal processing protease
MKKLFVFILLFAIGTHAQDTKDACSKFARINTILQAKHYKPKPLNDSLSAYVFNTVIDQLDENHILFTENEYKALCVHKYMIDDYVKNQSCNFLSDFSRAYKKALERKQKMISEISSESLTYFTTDTIYYSKKAFAFINDTERIKRYNRKKITYDILENIAEQSSNKDSLLKVLPKLFAETKTKIIDTYLCKVNNLLNPTEGFDNALYDRFFAVFCSYFDPHSTYFNYNDKASFVSSISTQSYSLGIYVGTEDGDDIIIDEVIPGGPAFKTHRIEKGDKLIKLASNGKEYTVSCASMDAINNMVVSDTYKNVELTLRKKDGTVYSVNVVKEIMKDDQNLVYHYLLSSGNNKTGYLKIPSFYTNYDNPDGKGVAADVATALAAMTKEDIKGLIIDLQYNGGGSMDEVIQLCGMFINYGPVTILTDRELKYNTIRDYNRGMLYNGPMVVLVNGYSASASEFFAGVMQDYNRAVIVGTTTHGKASMQSILPLNENDQNDFVKVTVDKFYRVSGKSSQYSGIVPDIALPTLFDILVQRESGAANALQNDSINVKLRYNKLPDVPVKQAVAASQLRVKNDAVYTNLQKLNDRINIYYNEDRKKMPVTFTAVFNMVHSSDVLYKEIKTAAEAERNIVVTGSYEPEGSADFVKTVNDYKIKSIKTDPYIYESLNILRDLNSFKKQ